jgi:hypothetical protein
LDLFIDTEVDQNLQDRQSNREQEGLTDDFSPL